LQITRITEIQLNDAERPVNEKLKKYRCYTSCHTTTTTTTVLRPFNWDYLGEPVLEHSLTHLSWSSCKV